MNIETKPVEIKELEIVPGKLDPEFKRAFLHLLRNPGEFKPVHGTWLAVKERCGCACGLFMDMVGAVNTGDPMFIIYGYEATPSVNEETLMKYGMTQSMIHEISNVFEDSPKCGMTDCKNNCFERVADFVEKNF